MGKIKGIRIKLIEKIETGLDEIESPIYKENPVLVDNVLVAPVSSDDVISSTNLYGKKAVYVLGIPKGDRHNWEGQEVEFFGQRWKTFGKATQGIDDLIPLEWNKKVWVEAYE